jgi:prepilin-type processing-associated H-X9-DG protein
MGIGFQLYRDDHQTKFPSGSTFPGGWSPDFGGGDPDRTFPPTSILLAATNRPLWRYLAPSQVFACPADRGGDITPHWSKAVKSVFRIAGSSYRYNANPWCEIRPDRKLADPNNGLEGKPENWITQPSLHVVLHCLAALPWQHESGQPYLHVWHYPSGSVTTSDLQSLSKKTVAPVLFVDGHVKHFNLKQHFRQNPRYYAEPTSERVWYKGEDD